jgi:indolepyruvate ferredoxin oxidoreductase, beta subunit
MRERRLRAVYSELVSEKSKMSNVESQQIIVSGVGGQGVLFVTKLLAETALSLGYSVLISETHGMAQRGGIVISHLKIAKRIPGTEVQAAGYGLVSPLIRPGRADILLALHPDGFLAHAFYLKPDGKSFRNVPQPAGRSSVDATAIASSLGSPVSANLVLLGFAVGSGRLFCQPEHVEETLGRYGGMRLDSSLKAFHGGLAQCRGRS